MIMAAITPIGRFTKNTHRHKIWSVINPPITGPTTDDRPQTPLKVPASGHVSQRECVPNNGHSERNEGTRARPCIWPGK